MSQIDRKPSEIIKLKKYPNSELLAVSKLHVAKDLKRGNFSTLTILK